MRPSVTQLVFIFILAATLQLSAKNVDVSTARQAGTNFLASRKLPAASLHLAVTKVIDDQTLYYIFNSGGKGFVIVAADDNTTPILGYSGESVWQAFADTSYGNNIQGWMESYGKQILDAKNRKLTASPEIEQQWQNLLTGQVIRETTTVVTPLLTTTWNQGWPYNSMCPVDASGPGGHVLAGCVGTALAQILKYHNYPSQGLGSYGYQWGSYPATTADFGSTTYNWTNMPNAISTVNTDVATLIYQAAVSFRSMWGAGSTGVSYLNTEDPMTRALPNYFKFAFAGLQYVDKANYTSTQWDNLIQTELLANRPVFYRGDGSGGHAFVCDGVDASNLYHFNWGWGGSYNGYFALAILNPGGNNYSNNQGAIIGIKPNDGSTLVDNTTWSGAATFSTNMAVPDAVSLTVNAGATIRFAQNCKLQVWGKLSSTGTSSSYATFTAVDTTTGWSGIKFDNNYMNYEVMPDNDSSKFVYTQIQYSDMRGVTIKNFSKVVFDHCKINNNFINGDEYGYYNGDGAGVFVHNCVVKITNSDIYNNHAIITGGGIRIVYNATPASYLSNNHIYGNAGDVVGGGFYLQCAAIFSGNIIDHNSSYQGAGGALGTGNISITNNKFCNNSTVGNTGKGGGLYFASCTATVVNNLFANNFAKKGSALCITTNSTPLILNCTVSGNYAGTTSSVTLATSSPSFKNTIFYGNFSTDGKEFLLADVTCDPFIDHCDLQVGINALSGPGSGTNYTTGNFTNNIDLAPLFVSPSAGTGAGYNGLTADWSLQSTSSCINAGDITGVAGLLPVLDLAGNPRINGIIDLGTYEYGCTPVPVSVSVVANNNPICAGTGMTFTATPVNGGTTPGYQWKVNGVNAGTNSSTYTYVPTNSDIVTCVVTSNLACTTNNPATSTAITMAVTSPLAVSVSIVANNNPICAGTSVTFTATPANGGTTPGYQWKVNGVNAGTNSSGYTYVPTNGDIVTCVLTSNLTCTTNNPAISNAITLEVNEHPSASAGNDQSIGYGASTILNGLAAGGSGTCSWHWEPASMLVNADIQNPVTLNLTITEQFSLTVTDALTGCEGTDEVLVTIAGGPLALDVTGTPATTCAGEAVQLMALVGGGTGNYTYSWSSDPPGFTSDIQNPVAYPAMTTIYNVVVNDGNATLSDFITVTVNPLPPVPAMPAGPDAIDLLSVTETQYSIPVYEDASSYTWELAPGDAGFITGFDTLAIVTWDPGYLGDATIRVKSTNSCGESCWSAPKVTFVNNTTGINGEVTCRPLVYPNPSNGSKVMISFCQIIVHVEIIDGKGLVLYSAAPGADHCVFQPALAKGIYFVKVIHAKGIAVEKLIVD